MAADAAVGSVGLVDPAVDARAGKILNGSDAPSAGSFAGPRREAIGHERRRHAHRIRRRRSTPRRWSTPPDATELELEPGHPGLGDEEYIRRRKELFALCRQHRLERLGPPLIEYTPEETRIWREVSPKLDELHVKHASAIYLEGQARAGDHPRRDPATAAPERARSSARRTCTWSRPRGRCRTAPSTSTSPSAASR